MGLAETGLFDSLGGQGNVKPVSAEGGGDLQIEKLLHEGSDDLEGVLTVGWKQVE